MTARARRNEVLEEDLFPHVEFLTFGTFKEDNEDEGYKATQWVAADDLMDVKHFKAELEELESLTERHKLHLFPEDDDDSD